ncbi:MAG: hypothetical protein PHN69_00310 [Candidatus Pacebacteria bacterium]|nr:hypothetical protein [Candidatus Paceibacterota bacterium]
MQTMDPLQSYDLLGLIRSIFNLITGNTSLTFLNNIPYYLVNFFARFAVFSVFFCIVVTILIIIYINKGNKVKNSLMDRISVKPKTEQKDNINKNEVNPKWKLVEEHIDSDDQNKWKLAILEADIILADLLDGLSLPGESIGEKLKAVEQNDFETIEQAWEAHKIRNAIAHEGSDFVINQREAKRIIGLYASVFKEFKII